MSYFMLHDNAHGLNCIILFQFLRHIYDNHNHPSNGWFAQGLKATDTNPRLKARAFSLIKPYCICHFGIPLKGLF